MALKHNHVLAVNPNTEAATKLCDLIDGPNNKLPNVIEQMSKLVDNIVNN